LITKQTLINLQLALQRNSSASVDEKSALREFQIPPKTRLSMPQQGKKPPAEDDGGGGPSPTKPKKVSSPAGVPSSISAPSQEVSDYWSRIGPGRRLCD
jgi:hypothetical protein